MRTHPEAATRDETVADLIRGAKRRSGAVPIRKSFLQQESLGRPCPGPLAEIVRARDVRALDLYLILRATASAEPWDVARDARVWARAIGFSTTADAGAAAISRVWHRLDKKYGLVRRERKGRTAKVYVLCEDGTGNTYTYPRSAAHVERYFKIPIDYWTAEERWHRSLTLPAKAMLLVSLTLPVGFVLPVERAPQWYGLSADTAGRGLRELDAKGLLRREVKVKKAPQAPLGYTQEIHHTLLGPFAKKAGPIPRRRLQVVS